MTIDDVLLGDGSVAQYQQLKRDVLALAKSEGVRFGWLTPALGETTEQIVGDRLTREPPMLDAYDPSLFDEHLSRANGLLDRCVDRSMQLNELESQAFLSAIGYLTEESQAANDAAIAKLNLKAARRQAAAVDGDADESVLDEQFKTRRGLRRMRMSVHSAAGHALNYGERLGFLRELQFRDIRSIYELMGAARWGMAAAVGLRSSEPPVWRIGSSENLRHLAEWSLDAIRQLDLGRRRERIVQRVLRLNRNLHVDLTKFMNAEPDKLSLDFSIDPKEHLELEPNETARILSLGFAVELDETKTFSAFQTALGKDGEAQSKRAYGDGYLRAFREKLLFSLDVTLPAQDAVGMNHSWSRPLLELRNEVRIWQNFENEGPATNRLTQVRNTVPTGKWHLSLINHANGPDYDHLSLNSYAKPAGYELLQFKDLVLWLRLAVRPVS